MKIILIGSSPAMMLQALVLSRKYNDIEIHEKKKEAGGSWKTSNFYNLKSVETGTHILAPWKNNRIFKESLSILKKKIGLRLFLLKPAPERLINKNISKKEIKKIKYFYIKGGAKKIIDNIKSLLKKKKIKIYYNSKISNKLFNTKKNFLTTLNQKKTRKIYLPFYCNLGERFSKKYKIPFKKKFSIHIIIEYLNLKRKTKNFSYIQVSKFSRFVDRAAKISNSILSKNRTLFCLRLSEEGKILYKKKSYYVANKVSNDLTNFLRLPEKKYRINYRFYKYETSYRDIEDLKRLKKFTSKYNKCILVDTSELMKYIGKNLLELKKLKNYGKKETR